MQISFFGIKGYRSYGEYQLVGPCSKINLLIGQNNVGKSNICLFLYKHYCELMDSWAGKRRLSFQPLDYHVRKNRDYWKYSNRDDTEAHVETKMEFVLAIDKSTDEYERMVYGLVDLGIDMLLDEVFEVKDNNILITFTSNNIIQILNIPPNLIESVIEKTTTRPEIWCAIWQKMTGRTGGSMEEWITGTIKSMYGRISFPYVKISIVPAGRKIGHMKTSPYDHSGSGIVDKISRLTHGGPRTEESEKAKAKMDKFLCFLQTF